LNTSVYKSDMVLVGRWYFRCMKWQDN
jgi:hypothetical protein